MEEKVLPRELTGLERELLFSILPGNKPGYIAYREKLNLLIAAAQGKFGSSNLILAKPGIIPDLSSPSTPVFALGTIIYENNQADIIIHEDIESEIEIDISFNDIISGDLVEIKRWSYSGWVPGNNAPCDNSEVREIEIIKGSYVLVIAPIHKKIWVYNYENGVNVLIPVTNFYNYLMMVKNIRNVELVFKPALLFSQLNNYKDEELRPAFFAYNKYFRRLRIENVNIHPGKTALKSKINLFNLFKRG